MSLPKTRALSLAEEIGRNGVLQIPAMFLPGFRTTLANANGTSRRILFKTWGGIGDQICAEPTLRYALKYFKNCEISLASECPDLFRHLKFKRVFNLKEERPLFENYLCFETITPPDDTNMVWQFFNHMITHCVDFPSLCALRCQLPISEREVKLSAPALDWLDLNVLREIPELPAEPVFVHAGKHWQSKTFPKPWWDAVLAEILRLGKTPVLIGADADDNRGTVDVDASRCVDFRNHLSICETVALLESAKVLLTNDSAPLHMAVPGSAWIGFIATCKHPDFITHYRRGEFGWRMKNHGKGGIWDVVDYNPNRDKKLEIENIDPALLESWLPDPKAFAAWGVEKANT